MREALFFRQDRKGLPEKEDPKSRSTYREKKKKASRIRSSSGRKKKKCQPPRRDRRGRKEGDLSPLTSLTKEGEELRKKEEANPKSK